MLDGSRTTGVDQLTPLAVPVQGHFDVGRAGAVAFELQRQSRRCGRERRERRRGRGEDASAGRGRAGGGGGADADAECGDAVGDGGQVKAPACCQVERWERAAAVQDDGGDGRT